MKVGVAFPLSWVARRASMSGCRIVFSGNGSDELVGGYSKYVEEYVSRGEAVREMMYGDVEASLEVNYERDYKACFYLGVELATIHLLWYHKPGPRFAR